MDQEDRRREGNVHVAGGCTEWGNKNRVDNPTAGRRLPPHEGHQDDQRNRVVDAGQRNVVVDADN